MALVDWVKFGGKTEKLAKMEAELEASVKKHQEAEMVRVEMEKARARGMMNAAASVSDTPGLHLTPEQAKRYAEKMEEAFYKKSILKPPTVKIGHYTSGSPLTWDDALSPAVKMEMERYKFGAPITAGPTSKTAVNYGTRLYPKETRSAIQMLHGNPSAMSLLFAMTTCIGFGCVVKADRKKLVEITGFSVSTYTRALNTLLGLGLVYPNISHAHNIQEGFVVDADLPKKNGRRYKIAPFVAFRGSKEFQAHELNNYNQYLKARFTKGITPREDGTDQNPEFVQAQGHQEEPDGTSV